MNLRSIQGRVDSFINREPPDNMPRFTSSDHFTSPLNRFTPFAIKTKGRFYITITPVSGLMGGCTRYQEYQLEK